MNTSTDNLAKSKVTSSVASLYLFTSTVLFIWLPFTWSTTSLLQLLPPMTHLDLGWAAHWHTSICVVFSFYSLPFISLISATMADLGFLLHAMDILMNREYSDPNMLSIAIQGWQGAELDEGKQSQTGSWTHADDPHQWKIT